MTERAVKREATGWRDAKLSGRMRAWGWNVPRVDLDFTVCEFDELEPVALIDWKHAGPEQKPLDELEREPGTIVLRKLGDRARLPVFLVLYSSSPWAFVVAPVNAKANATPFPVAPCREPRFVSWLYELRGREMPREVEVNLGLRSALTGRTA